LVGAVSAQTPRFVSATIRPSTAAVGERGGSTLGPGGSFVGKNVTLKQLIENAFRRFGFDRREVAGGPDWIATDRFDLSAQADRDHVVDPTGFPAETLRMVQRLLEDRFQLRIRREPRERPVYALVAVPSNAPRPRLTPSAADCASETLAQSRGDRAARPQCGPSPYPGRLVARSVTMADLASLLTPYLDRPVIDRSGIRGAFDVDLEAVEIQPKGPFGPSYRPSDTKASLFTAIVPQLGMRLEKTTAPIEILVVEHAEKPRAEKQDEAQPAWRDPSPHQTRFVQVEPSVRVEVLDWGGSGPPLVLLACYISAHTYDEIAPKLTNQFHVYGITRRGIGASDKPATGYAVQQSANDAIEVLNALNVQKSILVGHSCAGQILTMVAARHSDRLLGLVYLDGASDPTMTAADVGSPMPDPTTLPSAIKPRSAPDHTSFEALRVSQRRDRGWAFPEAELRQQFATNPDGSMGESLLSPTIRRAITVDARVKPDYSHIRVPVLAIYQKDPPFEQVRANFLIRNEQELAALRQEHAATRALYVRWQRDLLAAVPTARIVELEGASLYMFLSNEADVIRELRAFTP